MVTEQMISAVSSVCCRKCFVLTKASLWYMPES